MARSWLCRPARPGVTGSAAVQHAVLHCGGWADRLDRGAELGAASRPSDAGTAWTKGRTVPLPRIRTPSWARGYRNIPGGTWPTGGTASSGSNAIG